jgi:hypothetical protein
VTKQNLEPAKGPSLGERETLCRGGAKFTHGIDPVAAQRSDKRTYS